MNSQEQINEEYRKLLLECKGCERTIYCFDCEIDHALQRIECNQNVGGRNE